MATAKQRAAARRNIKKALAARRKKRHSKPHNKRSSKPIRMPSKLQNPFSFLKSTKRRRHSHSRKTHHYNVNIGEMAVAAALSGLGIGTLLGNKIQMAIPGPVPSPSPTPSPLPGQPGYGPTITLLPATLIGQTTIVINGSAIPEPGQTLSALGVNWGDGSFSPPGGQFPFTHTYATVGSYNIIVTAVELPSQIGSTQTMNVQIFPTPSITPPSVPGLGGSNPPPPPVQPMQINPTVTYTRVGFIDGSGFTPNSTFHFGYNGPGGTYSPISNMGGSVDSFGRIVIDLNARLGNYQSGNWTFNVQDDTTGKTSSVTIRL